ncbi:reverse transcriptase domain-containing protein [Tanacetum coccineum]
MPHCLFRRLGISKLKPNRMSIQLADRSIKYPIRVCENLLVKVNKFIFLVDFVVLEMDEDELVLIILGWPFLATAQAVIDVHEGKLSLRIRNEIVTFNIDKSMKSKYSRNDYLYCANHTAKLVREQWVDTIDHDGKWLEVELLEVLKNHKGAIAWSIADIKGNDSSFCTHKILMEDEFKPSVQPQRCVNPNIKEVDNMEVFMDDFSVFGSSFYHCLKNLEKMLKRCEDTNRVLNWEKCHFMVKEGIVLGHKVSGLGIEVDKVKIESISKLPYPTNVKAILSFMGHEFDIEIHDKKGAKNLAADHPSRLKNPDLGKLTKAKIRDLFLEEQLMTIFDKGNEPWYLQRSKCHSGPSGGHHGIATTVRKVFEAGFYWPNIFRDAHKLAIKACNMDLAKAGANRCLQINELDELRLDAYESSISYKERTKRWHNKRIKRLTKYEKGNKVLFFNLRLRLFLGKVKSRWYGPFAVSKDMKNGAIKLYDEDGNKFIVNKQRVKPYQKDALIVDKDDDITLADEREVT